MSGMLVLNTVTRTVSEALSGGVPLSVTRTVTGYTAGPWALSGFQRNEPLLALMVAPAGAPASRLNLNVFAGTSASVAAAVKVKVPPLVTALLPMGTRTGGRFTSLTATWKVFASEREGAPLSVTRTVTT